MDAISPAVVVLWRVHSGGGCAHAMLRTALRFMSPTMKTLDVAAHAHRRGSTVASHMVVLAPLAALAGILLKQLNPGPGFATAAGQCLPLLTMLMFYQVHRGRTGTTERPVAGAVLALIAARLIAKAAGVGPGVTWAVAQLALWRCGGLRDDAHGLPSRC